MTYRADIDGLRAIAVMTIVLFHMGLRSMSGGFVGVDVFFVISGFLITTLVLRDIEAGRFSFRAFYMRRLRRLGPALLATLLGTLAGGYFVLGSLHYELLAKSEIAAVLSVSNILFWTEAGYFDAEAIYKPLLHTWSLGVEEQFYLVWPTLLLLSHRFGRRGVALCLVSLSALSLVSAEAFLDRDPAAAFFLAPFRIYEFGIGAGLALMRPPLPGLTATRTAASLAGGAMIVGAAMLFDEAMRFPGVTALVPCLGAALVIWAGPGAGLNRLLALPPMRYLGRISYSLYLVHWPIVVFYAYRTGAPTLAGEVVGLTLLAIGIGSAMYHFVETPFRQYRGGARAAGFRVGGRMLGWSSLCIAAATITLAGVVESRNGLPGRLSEAIATLDAEISAGRRGRLKGIREGRCYFLTGSEERFAEAFDSCLPEERERMVVVLGDSHAADVWLALSRRGPADNAVQLTGAGCSLSQDFANDRSCAWFLDFAQDWISAHRDRIAFVLFTQRAARAMLGSPEMDVSGMTVDPDGVDRLAARLEAIRALGVPVIFWGPRPEFHPRIDVALASSATIEQFDARMAAADLSPFARLDAALAERFRESGVTYLSSREALCRPGCPYRRPDGGPVTGDYAHWTPEGGDFALERMLSFHPDLADRLKDAAAE